MFGSGLDVVALLAWVAVAATLIIAAFVLTGRIIRLLRRASTRENPDADRRPVDPPRRAPIMRIKTPSAKVGYLLVVFVGVTITVIPLAAIRYELGFAWAAIALVAAVVVAARTFRGAGESDAPRPWWKMTSTRGSGILLSVLFFVQGIAASFGAFASPSPSLAVTGGVVALIVAVFSLNSAIRVPHHVTPPLRAGWTVATDHTLRRNEKIQS